MPAIVYVPLDERPCNAKYPLQIAAASDLELVAPPRGLLGDKKRPAAVGPLRAWMLDEAARADRLIVSLDMLAYGGIVPSRLHHLTAEQCRERLDALAECKRRNPRLKIYAFNLILRAPAYDSSDEEPDYYAQYGARLARLGALADKRERDGLTDGEAAELKRIESEVPRSVSDDFIGRRAVNAAVNRMAVELAEAGVIDFLAIPLDDNAPYGFSAGEQRRLLLAVERAGLLDRVHLYPGADEAGCTLFARVFCELKRYAPEIYVRYSSTAGPFVIPKYEDRSLGESVKSHAAAAGACLADSSAEADFVLMVNAPPVGQHAMAEAPQRYGERHAAYFSETNLREFAAAIRRYADKGRIVALADVAVCNGADEPLMKLLAGTGLLPRLAAYAGWNTSGNSLGTAIAHAIVESYYRRAEGGGPGEDERARSSRRFLLSRLVEDWGYQAVVRGEAAQSDLPALGGSYFDVSGVLEPMQERIRARLETFASRYLQDFGPRRVRIERVELPWKRLFEVGFELQWN